VSGGHCTSRQVQAVLGIKPSTLRRWVVRGHVRKFGRDRYSTEDVLAHCRRVSSSQQVPVAAQLSEVSHFGAEESAR